MNDSDTITLLEIARAVLVDGEFGERQKQQLDLSDAELKRLESVVTDYLGS